MVSGWSSNPSARNLSLPPDWSARRRAVLDRDGRVCRIATRNLCIGRATVVDHVVAVANGGSHELSNLAAVCQPCHAAKTAAEIAAARWRYRRKRPTEPHPGTVA